MRKDIYMYLQQNKDLLMFLREQPGWYRILTRNPNDIQKMEIAALNYYKRTIPHQVEKFSSGVQLASMMMNMFSAMNSQS